MGALGTQLIGAFAWKPGGVALGLKKDPSAAGNLAGLSRHQCISV